MSVLDPASNFQRWLLTPQEATIAAQLSLLQKQNIQNHIADIAHQRIALVIDPLKILETIQIDAEMKGQILAYQYLLSLSNDADEAVKNGQTLTT